MKTREEAHQVSAIDCAAAIHNTPHSANHSNAVIEATNEQNGARGIWWHRPSRAQVGTHKWVASLAHNL